MHSRIFEEEASGQNFTLPPFIAVTDVALYHNEDGKQTTFALDRHFLGGYARISTHEELRFMLMYCESMLGTDWLTTYVGHPGLVDTDVTPTLAPVFVPPLASSRVNDPRWVVESVTSSPAASRPATSRAVSEKAEHVGYSDRQPTSPSEAVVIHPQTGRSTGVAHTSRRPKNCLEYWCFCLPKTRTASLSRRAAG